MERVSRICPVRGRVNEPTNQVDVLEDRSGPPVTEHDGKRAGHRRASVQEVHRLPVDLGAELRVDVEPVLPAAPVELLPPGNQAADPAERDTVGAVRGPRGLFGRPSCLGKPTLQAGQVGIGDLGGERLEHGTPSDRNGTNSSILSERKVPFQC